MKNLQNDLMALSEAVGVGNLTAAAAVAAERFSPYAKVERTAGLTVLATIEGEQDKTLLLDAHLDEVAFVVTDVDANGFLTVAACGGVDLRSLPAKRVTVHGKRPISAVFCSTPPHLSGGEQSFEKIDALKIDTFLGQEAAEWISVGDYVTYAAKPVLLSGNRLSGKSLDNRASVACLLELARRFSAKKPPMNLAFVLSDQEELGLRGIRTAAHRISPDEAVVLDVSFADGNGVSPRECGVMGKGPMIGFSPVLDTAATRKLKKLAEEMNLDVQTEVMGERTGTNADMVSLTGNGVPTALVSIPLRNMHTDVEVVDLEDLKAVCDLVERYIESGGNADV